MSHRVRLWLAAAAAVAVFACLIGLVSTGLRLAVAGLSPGHGLFVVPIWHSILTGLILTGIGCATFVASCLAAYVAASRRWDFHGHDWQQIVEKQGVGNAWDSLHAPGPEGEHRRAARTARYTHANTRRKARRQRRIAGVGRALNLTMVASSRERTAKALEDTAAEQSKAVATEQNKAAAAHARAALDAPATVTQTAAGDRTVAVTQTAAGDRTVTLTETAAGDRTPPVTGAGEGTGAVTQTAAGQRLLRILAGFNLLVLAGVLALGVGQAVAAFQSAWWAVVPASVIAFLVVHRILTTFGPLDAHPRAHIASWVLVAALAALSSPPVGLLVITGAIVSTWGRIFVRTKASQPRESRLRSPLPWLMAGLYTAVAVGYLAMPPVSFDGVTVQTASGQVIGGSLSQTSDAVHLIVCTPIADATSVDARLQAVPARTIEKISPASESAALDSGDRPSLPALVLNLVGIDWPPAIIVPNLHARQPTCAGAPPPRLAAGAEDPALGAGVIAGPAPPGGRAADGEPPIEQTTDPRIAALARRFQPTLEVSVADRFWPVSVGALLADAGPDGTRTCLVSPATSRACKPITSVPTTGQPADYLRFPTTASLNTSALTENPAAQFRVFEAGQHTVTGPLRHWLADPGILDPWRSAQLYFYYAGPVHFGGVGGQLPAWPTVKAVSSPGDVPDISDGLIGLEYWFFYPYNYYPLVTRSSLMNGAPVAGDVENVDLHQGDWEHVDVLLDQRTLNPVALYTARHANEGVFYYWNSSKLTFDGPGRLHPIVQAAIGGHPSYPNTCGGFKRSQGGGALYDWVVCGGGRYAFRAATTPLVDLGQTSWACWPGHFGEAKQGVEVVDPTADTLTTAVAKYVHVAGPVSPLRQAENGQDPGYGVCTRGAGASEHDALHGPLTPLLTSTFGQ